MGRSASGAWQLDGVDQDAPAELVDLDQSYRRLGDSRYAYAAPRFDYGATLEVAEIGFITAYPGLCEAIGLPSTQAS